MAAKLKRFSPVRRKSLKHLACLGQYRRTFTLALVHEEKEEVVDGGSPGSGPRRTCFPPDGGDGKFLHDRIQQAAYSLIPEKHRAAIHLRIGRALLASMTSQQLDEQLFDVANQLNRAPRG